MPTELLPAALPLVCPHGLLRAGSPLFSQEKRIAELERMKVRADDACRKLQTDIVAIKQQKVALHRHMDKSAREFADFRRQHDKELLQLRKQGRQNVVQLQRMEALHAKQQAVLRRKTGA